MARGSRTRSRAAGVLPRQGGDQRLRALEALVPAVTLALLVPGSATACDVEAADRQLRLAEADIQGGNPERAAAAASSALKLDPACTQALFVRGLALHRSGKDDEANALLMTYRDLRGSLALDARFELTLALVEAAGEPFDLTRALHLTDLALTQLDLQVANEQLAAVQRSGPSGESHRRMLALQARLEWTQGDRPAAERTWRQLFAEHPGVAVDSELPPEQLAVMARAQEAVAAGSRTKRPPMVARASPAMPWSCSAALELDSPELASSSLASSTPAGRTSSTR